MRITSQIPNSNGLFFCVSGGVDSIAACHWLVNKYRVQKRNPSFSVLHFHHGLRDQNDEMHRKVRWFAQENDLSFVVQYLTPNKHDENSLRACRIASMCKLSQMAESQLTFITAHHLDDAVENYVMNCMSGTPEYMPISKETDFGGFRVIHPFVTVTKTELQQYADEHKLMKFVEEDETNCDLNFKRNHIRKVIVPEIRRWSNLRTVVRNKFYGNNQ